MSFFDPPCLTKEFGLFVGASKARRNKKFECIFISRSRQRANELVAINKIKVKINFI